MWGDWLNSTDRDDLRLLVTRVGGVTGLTRSAAAALSAYQSEADDLQAKVAHWTRASYAPAAAGPVPAGPVPAGPVAASVRPPRQPDKPPAQSDLSWSYRCGLRTGLLVSGAAALPSAIGTGAAAALTAGAAGAIAAGMIVGATGGIAAIIVAGLLVMHGAKC